MFLLIALSVHSLCNLNQTPKIHNLAVRFVVVSTDFDLRPGLVSFFNLAIVFLVTGVFIFSTRYKSQKAMSV